MSVSVSTTNKPLNPRAQDLSPKGYNRAALYSGKALDFDGVNDYIDLDGFTMSGNTATFCFYADVDNDAYIFDINPNRFIFLHNTTQGIRVFNTTGWSDYGLIEREATLFYTIVCDGTSQSVYVNGQKFGDTKTITALNLSASTNFKLGSNYLGNGTFYNGTLSNYRLFNTALTAAQVADLYLNPEKIVPDGVADSALKLWLPMMEGAGTTAYDGSGNGNHGTINGATWVSGIGAPVAQTALVSWNKGTNLALYSEDLSNWTDANGTSTYNQTISPDGTQNADKFTPTSSSANTRTSFAITTGETYTMSVYLKKAGIDEVQVDLSNTYFSDAYVDVNLTSGTITGTGGDNISQNITSVGNEWYLVSFTALSTATAGSSPLIIRNNLGFDGSSGFYVWGASVTQSSSVQPYIPTLATAQTSPVLLPQGLTANKDITGVNAFESARNPYALNLDGASWGEVHDNASLDITDEISLECWFDNTNAYDSIRYLFDKSDNSTNGFELRLTSQNAVQIVFRSLSTISKVATIPTSGWVHVVTTYDGANIKMYIDGSLQSTTASTGTITANDYPLTIGGDIQNSNYSLNKPIALPRIYNRALTATEVARNYNADKSKFGL